MKTITLVTIGILLGVLEGALQLAWSLPGPPPDLLLVYIIWLGVARASVPALWVAFLGGLAVNLTGHHHLLGMHSLCYLCAGYLAEWSYFYFLSENRMTGCFLIVMGTLIQQTMLMALMQTLNPGTIWGTVALQQIVVVAGWNLLLWMILAWWQPPTTRSLA